ncbi:unnamed protein product [Musa acuminata subsp. malaccensis]|uniref:(wild Malaysian banana) hypothetical protein n=1 Tax=Musa acuminata subsp. malaccensis TaxID=214687 RepID=A0A804JVC4_MUSAM|nr:PREDICTED: uncharacterized protein LOC103991571 [Musa acuminata subsp. malaccensis]CAG1856470.1 unnamed protein product [Musa acuminata subsp. malaccensis]
MSYCDEAGDGPAVLQLQNWGHLKFQFQLSDFSEAFISPSRELLLLLSNKLEALLLPLVAGKESGKLISSDGSCQSSFATLQQPGLLPFCSPEPRTVVASNSSCDATCTTEPTEVVPFSTFAQKGNSSVFDYYPVISDVKSLAWGHCGDAYSRFGNSSFREFLIVSGNNDIIIHAFRYHSENTNIIESSPEDGDVHGTWVEWGSAHCSQSKEQFLHSHGFGNLHEKDENTRTSERLNVHNQTGNANSSYDTNKNWFRTFLTELETSVSDGKYLGLFPAQASFPHSANVVSFSIYDSTLAFLSYASPLTQEETHSVGTADGLATNESISKVSSSFQSKSELRGLSYKSSRVFFSTSHHFIGLALTFSADTSIISQENSLKDSMNTIVVVIKLHHWGIQWVCSVDLEDSYPGSGPSPPWADIQFSANFLVCLNTSGLVNIWVANTGMLVAQFDTLRSCEVDSGMPLSRYASYEESDFDDVDQGAGDAKNHCIFKKLVVVSHSLHLAIINEHGVVYLLYAGDYISEKHHEANKFMPHFEHFDLGILAGWKVAGSCIGSQQSFGGLSSGQELVDLDMSGQDFPISKHMNGTKQMKRLKNHFWRIEDQTASGFNTASQINCQRISDCESRKSAPMRRIFMPLDRFNNDDCICFSPFGITRLVKCCNLKERQGYKIVHTDLHVKRKALDEGDLYTCGRLKTHSSATRDSFFIGESLGCFFQGFLYLITQHGLSVVLPSISISSAVFPVKSIRYWNPDAVVSSDFDIENMLTIHKPDEQWRPWQMEVVDRILIFEGSKEAEHVCLENGWDLGIVRLRQMQLALQYFRSDVIEQSLDMLMDVNLAEEGILQLLFVSVHQICSSVGRDTDLALVSRLLALAARFAIKVIQRYGLLTQKKDFMLDLGKESGISQLQTKLKMQKIDDVGNLTRLYEMAFYLEVIRELQSRLIPKIRRPGKVPADSRDTTGVVDNGAMQDESPLSIVPTDNVSSQQMETLELQIKEESAPNVPGLLFDNASTLQLVESSANMVEMDEFYAREAGALQKRNLIPLENPKDMITRWYADTFDLTTIVKDALHAGRLPLAVLQLHLQHQKELGSEEPHDTFSEVCDIGKNIAYDLFLKGESGLAVATFQQLGEDVEAVLRQLLFGTVRRSLRARIAEEMKIYGYLRTNELKILEKISLIERLYSSSSFWRTFHERRKSIYDTTPADTSEADNLTLGFRVSDCFTIQCGDIDGVVIGSWVNIDNGSAASADDEDKGLLTYWACAAVWSDAWDQRTVDRIVLDQCVEEGVDIPWESQFEYHVSHSDLEEIYQLFNCLPSSLLLEGSLRINLGSYFAATDASNEKIPDCAIYICSAEDLEPVSMDVPHVKIFKFSAVNMCSSWLRMFVEEELAKKYIFLKECWQSTAELVPLLARAGLLICTSKTYLMDKFSDSSLDLDIVNNCKKSHKDIAEAFHKLVIHHCVQYNLPYLLDYYLDHHDLLQDYHSLCTLQQPAGNCHWANWLLTSRIKGCEYEASFYNARSNLSRQAASDSKLSVLEIDEIIHTVDDMAEGGGEMAALATLMYAAAPMQKCLCTGSVNRNSSSSFQCTLENLRPGLQPFPTLWRTLLAFCFGQDANGYPFSYAASISNILGKSAFSDYLSWRISLFLSAGGDTSLEQMLPCCLPKSVRKLIKTFVQGPIGWQSLSDFGTDIEPFLFMDTRAVNANWNGGLSAVSWEASIQKSIEEELYSSVEEKGFGVEHHLHRGRALAAFNHLLGARTLNLKSANPRQQISGKPNIQSDMQAILSPLTEGESSILKTVPPLAIMNFEDHVLVSSCCFFLELCGLSASILRVDIAALRQISSYYNNSVEQNARYDHVSPKSSAFYAVSHGGHFTVSLARALADDYIHHDHLNITKKSDVPSSDFKDKPSLALMTVLHHLEKASLPLSTEGSTCGSWLLSGSGDGLEFRSRQKESSQQWSLVTRFCQMHHLPLSTRYISLLAKDNDWVGFLTEAQLGGFAMDVIIQAAADFNDSRLKTHILTVLKSIQSTRTKTNSSTTATPGSSRGNSFISDNNTAVPIELFVILADCEKQKNPGEALLSKAKDLHWSLLAIIASCFSDVSPLSCLTVWLEITAVRETSCIKMDDVYSKIVAGVGAAVKSTNSLPSGSRNFAFHYNRGNAKRRCRVETMSVNSLMGASSDITITTSSSVAFVSEEISKEEMKKMALEQPKVPNGPDEVLASLSNMVAVLCEQHLFLPLLRAFDIFLPSCALLPFIRSLQAFSQMRLSEASAHLASFSTRMKEEPFHMLNMARDGLVKASWISSISVKAADAVLARCPSAYEKRCLLKLLAGADFADGGSASAYFRRLYWKINLAEPSLRKDDDVYLGDEILDDGSLLTALENNGCWEQARNWARQLESSGASWKSASHHVTEAQAEAMVAEWKEFLWDVPEERAALWNHCQTLFLRFSFPPLQAGLFFLKHAEAVEKEIPARELHEMLLLSLQWLSGTITHSPPVYPLHILREIETRVWLLAVESEAQFKAERDFTSLSSVQNLVGGSSTSIIEQTASIITKMDNHINAMLTKVSDRNGTREITFLNNRNSHTSEPNSIAAAVSSARMKRRTKINLPLRRSVIDNLESNNDSDDYSDSSYQPKNNGELSKSMLSQEESMNIETSISAWEKRVQPAEVEKAVLSLLEFGQITAAKQLQQKLSPSHVPVELALVDCALKVAILSSSNNNGELSDTLIDPEILAVIVSAGVSISDHIIEPLQALEFLAMKCNEGSGRGLCRRIIAVVKSAKVLGIPFSEAFDKKPIDLLQLLSLKAQDSLEEAKLLVQTHTIPAPSIARILAESFLKGLLAAHRGGYMDSQKEEGPAPLLWRFADFLKWAQLCPSEPEIGHALMRLVMTGQEIPHACEVELLILSHHFYKSSACLDGVDVLVTLAANRVESYVLEGDFSCLARLVTGVSNFHALNFILNILIENGQLVLLLQKYSTAEMATGTAAAVRGFRMAVLTSLKLFNPHDLDAFAMVYNHFDMKHETASLLESRSLQYMQQWLSCRDKDLRTEYLLDAMCHYIEAAEVLSGIDAGQKTHNACAQASLLSLQIRIPDINWIALPETKARRVLVEQSRFQEALIVAEAYKLNQPSEWAPVLWNQMLKPDLIEQFVAEFVAVLPLQPTMLLELARYYRSEVAARGDQSHFSVWLSPGGLPAEWIKHLGRSFRTLLKRTRDLRLRMQLATTATGFLDVTNACMKVMDKVPENAGPLILRRGHGGAYLPLM